MSGFLSTLFYFALALGVLIAVHEFGHFWVARKLGVKVLRFSIGFGKPLWRWRSKVDDTEYVVAALPLGGYVKMLDEREGEVPEHELHRAFNRQPVGKRFAIVFAGPLFNLLFAVVAYWAMFIIGIPGLKPVLGEVAPDTMAAQIGLHAQQRIVSIDGDATPTWGVVLETILPKAVLHEGATLTVADPDGTTREYRLPLDQLKGEVKPELIIKQLGLLPYQPKVMPIIDAISPGSPAEKAGLRSGDRVLAVDNQPIERWEQLVKAVRAHPGKPMAFEVDRSGKRLALQVTPAAMKTKAGVIGHIGAGPLVPEGLFDSLRAELHYGPLKAIPAAIAKTWDMSSLTLKTMYEMVAGRTSVENLSGPITIARYAKSSASAGLAPFLSFLAIVSVSLGVLNLLPVPVLDGGHLMFYLVELVTGRPVSERTEIIGQKIGIALIAALMFLAFYNDLMRLIGSH